MTGVQTCALPISIAVDGQPVVIRSPRDAMRHRIGLVPEDRKQQGAVLSMRNRENTSMAVLPRFARASWIDRRREGTSVARALDAVAFRGDAESPTGTLSGGNQQKVVLAKWLAAESDILILDEPTRGVDVRAKAELHAWIDQFARRGGAVLLISSELPELLNLSTRVLVLREGRLAAEYPREGLTQDRVLRAMSGLA